MVNKQEKIMKVSKKSAMCLQLAEGNEIRGKEANYEVILSAS